MNAFVAQRLLCVCILCVKTCAYVSFRCPGQVCSYLIPTTVSESCGAGLIVSADVCVRYSVVVSVCVHLE